jgi:hypothetical protein
VAHSAAAAYQNRARVAGKDTTSVRLSAAAALLLQAQLVVLKREEDLLAREEERLAADRAAHIR